MSTQSSSIQLNAEKAHIMKTKRRVVAISSCCMKQVSPPHEVFTVVGGVADALQHGCTLKLPNSGTVPTLTDVALSSRTYAGKEKNGKDRERKKVC